MAAGRSPTAHSRLPPLVRAFPKAAQPHDKYADPALDAPELVIVAGISGSGKSTVIRQIKSGDLPEGVVLPDGIRDWPVPGCSERRRVYPSGAPGYLLHYDMDGRGLCDGLDYRDDPALLFVPRAKAITVINVRPSPDRLVRQLTDRESARMQKRQRDAQRRLIWRLAAPAIQVAGYIFPPHLMKAMRLRTPSQNALDELQRKLHLYEQPGWLDDIYGRWAAYLDSVAQTGKPVRQIFIEPGVEPFRWRLTSTPDKAST